MESVKNIHQLHLYTQVRQDAYNIIHDDSLGRKKAAEALTDLLGMYVSEKIVRNYRERLSDLSKPVWDSISEQPEDTEPAYSLRKNSAYIVDTPQYHMPSDTVKTLPGYSTSTATRTNKGVSARAKTIVVMPDVQAPLHDAELVDKFIGFVKDFQPDELAQVGDFTDSTEISRWVRGKKTEYAGDLQQGFDTSRDILRRLREACDKRMRIVRSNHDDRLELYIQGCAPGLESLRALTVENLVGFSDYDVEFIRDEVVELTPGADAPWVMAHGDEGSLSPVAGKTAFNLAKNKFGANVVCGHTHRAGLTSESHGYNGRIRDTRYGLEVGHFMDITKADYLKKKGVAMNWQQAFGILYIHGSKVYPQLVTVNDGNFSVEGKLY